MGGNRLLAVTGGAVVLAVLVLTSGSRLSMWIPIRNPITRSFWRIDRAKPRRKLLEYGRSVEVLWNPNSTSFAVTDYAGSNVADCLVFSVTDGGEPQNVADALSGNITNPKEQASLRDSSHIYWTAVRWKSPHSLLVKVWGHTDVAPARNFQYFHTYNVPSGR